MINVYNIYYICVVYFVIDIAFLRSFFKWVDIFIIFFLKNFFARMCFLILMTKRLKPIEIFPPLEHIWINVHCVDGRLNLFFILTHQWKRLKLENLNY